MSEQKHTAGPWTVKYYPGHEATGIEAKIAEMTDSEPYNLAVIDIPETGFRLVWDDRREDSARHIADAHLKTAAPAMYEALKELIAAHERSYDPIHKEAIAKARAALASAEHQEKET